MSKRRGPLEPEENPELTAFEGGYRGFFGSGLRACAIQLLSPLVEASRSGLGEAGKRKG